MQLGSNAVYKATALADLYFKLHPESCIIDS